MFWATPTPLQAMWVTGIPRWRPAKAKVEHGSTTRQNQRYGITRDLQLFREDGREDWDAVIETNLNSMFNVTKQVVADMVEKGWGASSTSARSMGKGPGRPDQLPRDVFGMHGFSMALAQELASKGVTVNTVAPGYIGTDMVKAIPPDAVLEKIVGTVPSKALGRAC